jgi:peptidoglycan endopeptidase LytE
MKGRWTYWSFSLLVLFLFVLQPLGFAEERYTVKPGDNLYKISKTYGISVGALKASNHLEKEALRLNQVLLIPTSKENEPKKILKKSSSESSSYVVKRGDSLSTISRKVGLSVDEIKQINHLRTNNLTAGQTLILSVPRNATGDPDEESGDEEDAPEVLPDEGEGGKEAAAEPAPGGWKSQEERNLFVRVVKNFLGVPYRLGGSTLKGIDCSAFVKRIYEIFNTELPRTTWEQLRIGKKVGKGDLEEGDLVFFKVPTRRTSNRHVGIYIGNNEFVHASSRKKEVRVDSLEAPYFSKRFINGIRVKELDRKI